MSLGDRECVASQLVTKNHCCQIPASHLTNLSDLCHLSHKTASKLHLLNSTTAIELLVIIHHRIFASPNNHTSELCRAGKKDFIISLKRHFRYNCFVFSSYKFEPKAALRNDMHRRTDTVKHTCKHTNICTRHWDRNALGVVSRAWQGNTRQPRFQEHTEGSKAESGAWPRYVSRIECQEISPNSFPQCKNIHMENMYRVQRPGNTLICTTQTGSHYTFISLHL